MKVLPDKSAAAAELFTSGWRGEAGVEGPIPRMPHEANPSLQPLSRPRRFNHAADWACNLPQGGSANAPRSAGGPDAATDVIGLCGLRQAKQSHTLARATVTQPPARSLPFRAPLWFGDPYLHATGGSPAMKSAGHGFGIGISNQQTTRRATR